MTTPRLVYLPVRVDYAMRALALLATDRQPIACPAIASAQSVPLHFLRTIMRDMSTAGILHCARGRGGGYSLTRSPGDISMADVIQASAHRCTSDGPQISRRRQTSSATGEVVSSLNEVWERLNKETLRLLGQITVADVIGGMMTFDLGA